jgi:hypothetical protein
MSRKVGFEIAFYWAFAIIRLFCIATGFALTVCLNQYWKEQNRVGVLQNGNKH